MKIIFNADDFGFSKGANLGILDAHLHGIVTSTTLMANMPAFDHAIKIYNQLETLHVGVHLVLTLGKALGGKYNTITDAEGNFFGKEELVDRAQKGAVNLKEVEKEFSLQIDKIKDAGVSITHIDGHNHAHCLPGIMDISLELALKHGVGIRLLDRSVRKGKYASIKSVNFSREFSGNNVSEDDLIRLISECKEDTEFMCHPAYIDTFLHENSANSINKAKELDALTSQKVLEFIETNNIQFSNYRVI